MAHAAAGTQVILLGDHDTVLRHRDELSEHAARHGCVIAGTFSFAPGEAAANDDLTQLDAVVAALGQAIATRLHVWVPFAGPDFGREQHWRRLSLVLQRHGLNALFGRELEPAPISGGFSDVDIALRREVQTVDDLDHAALALVGAESLSSDIESALVAAASATRTPPARRASAGAGGDAGACPENVWPPKLPAPAERWEQRGPVLKRYVRWLVNDCGVTQVATARILNSAGQRTRKGRPWQPTTVSALLNG